MWVGRERTPSWLASILLVTLAGGLVGSLLASPASAQSGASAALSGPGHHEHHGIDGETDVNVCSDLVPAGIARCLAHVRTDAKARSARPHRAGQAPANRSAAAALGNGGAYDPAYLQSAYNAPSASGGSGQTVAIVDAFDDPNAAADLAAYRSHFGLPACTTANGCFRKVDQRGGTSYPTADAGWSQEISLDLDMVSAVCPNCHILLVEADNNSLGNLGTAVNTAVNVFHANVVSNSYGSSEYAGETTDSATYYNHPGVAIVVSSGDSGYGVQFPASSQYVTAVGGTSLTQNTNTGTRNGTEMAWSGAGSGCSAYEVKPSWQQDTGCANRTVADVSAVADPHTGVWVYDTYGTGGTWAIFGGTSAAAPIAGSVYALAGNPSSSNTLASYPYSNHSSNPSVLNDVTSGSNGSCGGSYLCTAVAGYDGPTGLGTPNSDSAFKAAPSAPSAPRTLSATPSPTQVKLTWSAPASNGGSAITSYNVYRGTTSNGEGATPLAAGITSTSYTDTAVTKGTTYFYKVTAVNSLGEGLSSNEASAKPASVPTAPLNLTAKTSSTRGVTLTWQAPKSDGGSAITSYQIYRSRSSGKETAYVKCTASTCTATFTDSSTTKGVTYYYQVAAINAIGTGPRSNQASAKAR